jgi:hypothetical protein
MGWMFARQHNHDEQYNQRNQGQHFGVVKHCKLKALLQGKDSRQISYFQFKQFYILNVDSVKDYREKKLYEEMIS